ncbi:MAG: hypothetical protein CMN04_02310 [Roseibacillus sp.]|nr:hypothetical protein [Roseibacillus sp.]|tara:strand:- start:5170 stop:6300 length:1131 start_codon:yes stop_codon:yes gene_type:complete
MRLGFCLCLFPLVVQSPLGAQSAGPSDDTKPDRGQAEASREKLSSRLPELPVWSPSDYEGVKKGEIVAGENFFGQATVDPEATIEPPVLDLPEDVEPLPEQLDQNELLLSSEQMAAYFRSAPEEPLGEVALIKDPQDLLSQQEFRDCASFLSYHSNESEIDIALYLFDERQELSEEYSIDKVHQLDGDFFKDSGPVVSVYFHLGAPNRAQLMMSPEIRAVIPQDEQERALRASIVEAFEKTDEALQLDSFLGELSTRLYWIERELEIAGLQEKIAGVQPVEDFEVPERSLEAGSFWVAARAGLILLVGLGGFIVGVFAWRWNLRQRKYYFPEVDDERVFGAPHAAGAGAVVTFADQHLPPSRQRHQEAELKRWSDS